MRKRLLAALVGAVTAAASLYAYTIAQAEKKHTVDDLSWLAGHWVADYKGLRYDDIYSEPRHGTMMGIFRVLENGNVRTYGAMSLTDTESGVVFRYRRMSPDLTPKAGEIGQIVERSLLEVNDRAVIFEDMRFELINRNKMLLTIPVTHTDGTEEEARIEFYRPCAGVCLMP